MRINIPWKKAVVWLIATAVGLGSAGGAMHWVRQRAQDQKAEIESEQPSNSRVELVPGTLTTLTVPSETHRTLGISSVAVEPAPAPDPLRLSGSLLLDSARLVHVHTRFGGEVVAIGTCMEAGVNRPLRLNDKVSKGQFVAVIWSKEVGETKSDLVDALSQLLVDQSQLARLKKLGTGFVPEKAIQEAERNCEKDTIRVERIERTLRSWRLTDEEIEIVKKEAIRIHNGEAVESGEIDRTWAEVDIRAPFDGVILEKNIAVGDIVNTDLDLFQIADLSKLTVMANIYEEDIPALESLPADKREWQITLKAEPDFPPIKAHFDVIGSVIDPKQHTGIVMGWVDNPQRRLKVAQFITATINLPAPTGEVAIPVDAVIDEGGYSLVFVADDSLGYKVTERKVMVARQGTDFVFIRNALTSEEISTGMSRLEAGEFVITNGNVELAGALQELRSSAIANAKRTARAP